MNRLLIIAGIVLIIIGLIGTYIGKLPGDMVWKKGNTTVYFPIMTSIIISVVLSLIFMIIGRFK
ncbi:DUF2905 domain-containing protein [Fictibacillus barbaricus]|jgi:hypothetical protein|uniref:DUF2905 domain-containing protein n=1 Tax=Fictibacillus barbaricus TaxID=182136 RepID=A0ABS2ZLH2_9BACL|nr:DUF2905 domain-containing protein [Fictibacillus barbaricus]MBN3547481.1 DUF2905 domain-containing protein [Fictibacillus barbaricus]GGB49273.1 hypothetical protein GCM10007199_13630 [Fictibacillus barbaricus]